MTNMDDHSSHFQTTSNNENYIVEPRMEGPVRKYRAVERSRQEKKIILAATRRKAKEVQACIDDGLIKWGDYNPRFEASDTEGGKELHDFLQRLEAVSKYAITKADTVTRFVSKQRNSTKLNFLENIYREISSLQPDDVILLTDSKSLSNALDQPFGVPLLHRATPTRTPIGPGGITPEELLTSSIHAIRRSVLVLPEKRMR
jgi:hypothetical protein